MGKVVNEEDGAIAGTKAGSRVSEGLDSNEVKEISESVE